MNNKHLGTLWVVALVLDTAFLIALCVTIGLLWN
jgi:hypothetical protein